MPIYVYRCKKCNNKFEEIQKFSDPPLTECRAIADGPIPYSCDGELEKLSANKTSFHFAGQDGKKIVIIILGDKVIKRLKIQLLINRLAIWAGIKVNVMI